MAAPVVKYTTPPPACIKCGNADPEKITATFVRANQYEGKDYEYLDVTCNKCGYEREMLPEDSAAA